MRKRTVTALAGIAVLVAIQFIPVDRSNPPVRGEIDAPKAVSEVFQRSCYDCHSNETNWPWYSYVAPVSWLVAHDVHEGREELNFSTWSGLNEKEESKIVHKIWEETSEGEMPLKTYLILHPGAKLSDEALETLRVWSRSSYEE